MNETVLPSSFAAESGHWYARDGAPVYEVENVSAGDGSLRPTTIRDARKLRLVPSVSGIIKCAATPGLERWKREQTLLAALTLPRREEEPESEWLERVWTDSNAQARKAAERGTAIHGSIECYYRGRTIDADHRPHVMAVNDVLHELLAKENGELPDVLAERSFACPVGFGGKLDLAFGDEVGMLEAIVDAKTKEFDETGKKKLAWDEHCIQLAAYRHGFGHPAARCINLFVSASVPGLVVAHEWSEPELDRGWAMFRHLLSYWQEKNRYISAF